MLTKKIKDTIKKYGLLKNGDRVLVAVSGGIDSAALLFILNSIKKEYNLKLSIAHLNHMMRKNMSNMDEKFVKDIGRRMRIPVTSKRINVPRLISQTGLSAEECARQARYDFLVGLAKLIGFNKVAIAHHKDDQAETVLMRLLRGSGLRGLCGISPKRYERGLWIIRPMIETEKREIVKFVKKLKIGYRRDASNFEDRYFRNRIRNKLIPLLEKDYNPAIKRILANLAENISLDYQCLQEMANKKYDSIVVQDKDVHNINLSKLFKEHPAIQRLILRKAIEDVKGDLNRILYRHWKDLEARLAQKSDFKLNLPKNIFAKRQNNKLLIYKKVKVRSVFSFLSVNLRIPGITRFGGYDFKTSLVSKKIHFKKNDKSFEYFDLERLKLPLKVRHWKSADTIRPLGMMGKKKLHDLFIDEKIPYRSRSSIPVVLSGNKIIWVCGIRMCDDLRVSDKTRNVLKIEFIHAL